MFTHLHCHGSYSVLDGLGSPNDMAKAAKEMGFSAIGITDHGNIDSFVKWQNACLENNISPVFGVEMYIDENRFEIGKEAKRFHICLFIKNQTGFENVQKLLTIGNLEGFSRKPRIDPASLLENSDGLILSTACLGSFIVTSWGKKLLKAFLKKHPGDVYFEIMPVNIEKQRIFNLEIIGLAKKFGCKIIATNDLHYIKPEDAELQEVLLCINSADKWDNPNRFKFDCNTHYMCSQKQMIKMFQENHKKIKIQIVRQALANTQEIVEKCKDFRLKKYPVVLPLIPQCNENNENDFFEDLIYGGLKKKVQEGKIKKEELPVYRDRIKEELGLLKEKGFIRYFLIVWELINWCRQNNIMVGPGRGSAGGSLIAYLIDIVSVNPMIYGLLFARFISPDRCLVPETFVKTRDGDKQIRDIFVGTEIINKNGEFEKVERKKEFRIEEKIYKFKTENGIVKCTWDHKFPVWDSKLNKETEKKAKDINIETDFFLENCL